MKQHPIQPSACSLSDGLNNLLILKEEIDNTILDREKLCLISDASYHYNSLAQMASPSYYTEMEEAVIRKIGNEWSLILAEHENSSDEIANSQSISDVSVDLNELADQLESYMNDLLDDETDFLSGDLGKDEE
jgi:hypothetical protein